MPLITFTLKNNAGSHRLYLLSFLFILTSLAGCTDECETTITYTVQEPIQMRRSELIQAVKSEPAHALQNTGKIYTKDHYVYINELSKGIHVIDNSNPKTPQPIAFISIPGNVDMAIRDNILFADAGPDLLTLNIADPTQVRLLNHQYNIFSLTNTSTQTSNSNQTGTLADMVTIGQNTRLVTEERACNSPGWGGWLERNDAGFNFSSAAPTSANPGNTTGVGGSMARFTITGQHLYAINSFSLRVLDISNPAVPQLGNLVQLPGGIETIFPYQDKLFIGSMGGMLIYSIQNAATPTFLGSYSHITRCDPVVVSGNYAYVTLRANPSGGCGTGNSNQLDVVDVSNPANPVLKKSFAMQSPYGLGIDANTLFVCEGEFGLKVFNAAEPLKVGEKQIAHFKNINMYDVIPLGNTLLAVGENGLYQYDYTNPQDIKYVSKLPVTKTN